jgi:hypothetical protein
MTVGLNDDASRRTVIVADKEGTTWSLFVSPADLDAGIYLEGTEQNPTLYQRPLNNVDGNLQINEDLFGGYYLQNVPFNRLLTEEFFANGDCDLVIEVAHLRFKNEKSKAQIYWMHELEQLNNLQSERLRVFEFPGTLTDRARIECGLVPPRDATQAEIDDAKNCDTEAICWFVCNRPEIELRRFDPSRQLRTSSRREQIELTPEQVRESIIRRELTRIRENCNERLNIMRVHGYRQERIQESPYNADIWNQIDHSLRILDDAFGDLPEDNYPDVSVVFGIVRECLNPTANYLRGRINELNDTIPRITLGGTVPEKRQRLIDLGEEVPDNASGAWCNNRLRELKEANPRIVTSGSVEELRNRLEARGEVIPEFTGRIYRGNSPGRHNNVNVSLDAIMSVYVCVFDDDGNRRRLNPDELEGPIGYGADFIWTRVLQMTNYHGRMAGVARSNLMYQVLGKKFELRGTTDIDPEGFAAASAVVEPRLPLAISDGNGTLRERAYELLSNLSDGFLDQGNCSPTVRGREITVVNYLTPSRRYRIDGEPEERSRRRIGERAQFRRACKFLIRLFARSDVQYISHEEQ